MKTCPQVKRVRDASLDSIKALATVLVVLVHASGLLVHSGSQSLWIAQVYSFLGEFSALGVPLFFMVSGYLAAMQYKRERPGILPILRKNDG